MKKGIKVALILSSIVALLGGGGFLCYKLNLFNDSPSINTPTINEPTIALSSVSNIKYETHSQELTWNKIENADLYKINANGKIYESNTNSITYYIVNSYTEIKVQACNSKNLFKSSEWSQPLEITIKDNWLYSPIYLEFDIKEGLITWKNVEYANKYKIIINDETFYTDTNKFEYWLKTKNFTCSVQALDRANYFKESKIVTIEKYYDNLYLHKIKNLAYNPETSILSWDKVEGASKYKIEADYGVYITTENRFKYQPKYKTTLFKVSTVPSSTDYLSNDPSSLSYENKESDLWDSVDLDKVNKFVNEMTRNWDLVKIASMYVDDYGTYCVQGWFKDSDGTSVVDLERYYDEKVSTLKEVMTKDKIGLGINNDYDRSYYDPEVTIQHLLNSNRYVGGLEDARLQGYDISCVSGVVGRISSHIFRIYGTYKLTREDEVKYVQSEIECVVRHPSKAETVNYNDYLEFESKRSLEEKSYHELTGDFAEWAEKYDRLRNGPVHEE